MSSYISVNTLDATSNAHTADGEARECPPKLPHLTARSPRVKMGPLDIVVLRGMYI
jgi:hypothetical protein